MSHNCTRAVELEGFFLGRLNLWGAEQENLGKSQEKEIERRPVVGFIENEIPIFNMQ